MTLVGMGFLDVTDPSGARPAFNLNLNSVLFTSSIPSESNRYKLTLKDSNLSISFPEGTGVTKSGQAVTVPYYICGTSAGNGTKAYVMITDKAYTASDAAVLQYTALTAGSTTGTGTFTLDSSITGVWGSNYHVYVLAVNEGGEKKSDYASTPVEIKNPTCNATGYDDSYDGQAHGISVSVTDPATGAVVKYGTVEGTYNLAQSPTITNVTDSPKTVYYQVSAPGYLTATGSATVTVSKADPTAPTGLTATYGQTLADVTLPDGWIWADSTQSVGNVVDPAATFKANFAGDDNHNAASDVDVTVTVNKANAVPATVTANNRTYDGTEKPLVTVTGEATGGEMQYALGTATEATQPYTTSIPSKTDAGTYYVWYKVKGDENHVDYVAETPVTVIIAPGHRPEIIAHSLILSGTIGVRFFVKIPDEKYVDQRSCSMTFKIYKQTGEQKVDFSEAEKVRVTIDDEVMDLCVYNCYVNSVQMADAITAELHYKEIDSDGKYKDAEESVTETYSARDYIRQFRATSNQYDQKTRDLVRTLGEYGCYAQQYLSELRHWTLGTGEDADHIAMDDYGYTPRSYSAGEIAAAAQALEANKISASMSSKIEKVTYSLFLDSDTKLCVYFKPKSNYSGGASATVDGKAVSVTKSNGRFAVEIPNIAAHKLGTTFTVQLVTGGLTTVVKVSTLSYVQSVLSSSKNEKEINAVMALYNYSNAAKAMQ